MSFLKRLFSSDHRAAVTAEAAGDFELAAERYALAGQRDAAVRMHMARAERAKTRAQEIEALRDAVHWAKEDPDCRVRAGKALGQALLAKAKAEGIKTSRDKDRVREAADLLAHAECYEEAGDAYETIGDDQNAAAAYRSGGLVRKMEVALSRETERSDQARNERREYADYDLHMRGGARHQALQCIRRCVQIAESRGDYRRLLDELESRMITGGRVALKTRKGSNVSYSAALEILIGRDVLCDLVLRTGGVSRRHASVVISRDADSQTFELQDCGSRNGTRVGGLRIDARLPLLDEGSFSLGDDVTIHYAVSPVPVSLSLEIRKGLDKGQRLVASAEGSHMSLDALGVAASVYFREGRPIVTRADSEVSLNGEHLAHGDIELIHGDTLVIDGIELEVV